MSEYHMENQAKRSTTIVACMLLMPLVVGSGMLLFLFCSGICGRSGALALLLFYAALCWICAVGCGWYVATQEKQKFPRSALTSLILHILSIVSLVASNVVFSPYVWYEPAVMLIFGIVTLSGAVWCLISICITFYIAIRGAIDGGRARGALVAQLIWAGFSLFFLSIIFGVLGGF